MKTRLLASMISTCDAADVMTSAVSSALEPAVQGSNLQVSLGYVAYGS